MRSDLTSAARIRDAAISVFGQRGFEVASIREIAQEAGVSPALVMHHYGSKDKLREYCDDFLIAEGLRLKADMDVDDHIAVADAIRGFPPDHPWMVYISRIILDGGPTGAALWDRFVAESESALETQRSLITLRPGVDRTVASVVATAVGLIPLVFQSHLARSLGSDWLDGEAYEQLMITLMDLLMSGLYDVNPKGDPA